MTEFRVALRMWLKSPGFVAVALLSLGLGIGANTTIFTLVNAVFFRPFAFPHPEELVYACTRRVTNPDYFERVSAPEFLDWKGQASSFTGLSAFASQSCNLRGDGAAFEVSALLAERDLLDVYGVAPLLGRVFAADEYSGPGHRVAMLGERVWRKHFASSREVIGRKVYLNGEAYSIVGVLPVSMAALGWEWGGRTYADIWLPLDVREFGSGREDRALSVVGRTKTGVTPAEANADLGVISTRLAAEYPQSNKGRSAGVIPIGEVEPGVGATWVFFSIAVGCVLLIACANLANMLLAKAVSRAKEIAVRTAIGASPKRIVKQLLVESFALALGGGLVGILFSHWGVTALAPLVPNFLLGVDLKAISLHVDWRVLAFTLLLCVGATFVFGMFPALQTARVNVARALQEGDRGGSGTPKQRLFIRSLVVSEVALSLMLLVGSVGFIRAIIQQLDLNPGYDLQHTAYLRLNLLGPKYADPSTRIAFVNELKQRLGSLPGVTMVAVSASLPRGGIFSQTKAYPTGNPPKSTDGGRDVAFCPASEEYFSLANLSLLRGRPFSAEDRFAGLPVVILNENAARKIFENGDALGKSVTLPAISERPFQVIGVARAYTNNALAMVAFAPITQRCPVSPYLLVRTKSDPLTAIPELRAALRAADADQPVDAISTMRETLKGKMEAERGLLALIGSIGVTGFILAVIGIGSVVNYAVAQRTREFGIRLSLGATRENILRLALTEAAIPLSIGLAIGFVGSLILQPTLWNMRTGVDVTEYPQYLLVALVFAAVALFASSPPARRAMRITPLEALRSE